MLILIDLILHPEVFDHMINWFNPRVGYQIQLFPLIHINYPIALVVWLDSLPYHSLFPRLLRSLTVLKLQEEVDWNVTCTCWYNCFCGTLTLLPITVCCILLYFIITSNSNKNIEEVIQLISLGIVRILLMQIMNWDARWKPALTACHNPKKPFPQASPPRWNEDFIYIYF